MLKEKIGTTNYSGWTATNLLMLEEKVVSISESTAFSPVLTAS
jgi:hypothetical protein